MSFINIATEDALGQAVAAKLVSSFTSLEIHLLLGRKGFGHLKKNLRNYIEIANRTPLLLLTDLDQMPCAPSLINNWMQDVNILPTPNFIFRVAVREIESWILADNIGCKAFFGFKRVPNAPDTLPDPKRTLLALASKSKREIRDDLIVTQGAIASQGPGYNARLTQFVDDCWDPVRAAMNSPSLNRACDNLRTMTIELS